MIPFEAPWRAKDELGWSQDGSAGSGKAVLPTGLQEELWCAWPGVPGEVGWEECRDC